MLSFSTRRVYILRHLVFDENTLPYVSPKQSQTNIDVPPHIATFVESFSILHAHDRSDKGKYKMLAHTLKVIMLLHLMYSLMNKSMIDLSGT